MKKRIETMMEGEEMIINVKTGKIEVLSGNLLEYTLKFPDHYKALNLSSTLNVDMPDNYKTDCEDCARYSECCQMCEEEEREDGPDNTHCAFVDLNQLSRDIMSALKKFNKAERESILSEC